MRYSTCSKVAAVGTFAALVGGCQREQGSDDAVRLAPDTAAQRSAAPSSNEVPSEDAPPAVASATRGAGAALPRTIARANLEPTAGNDVRGTVYFAETGNTLTVDVTLSGLTPGPHGLHVHEFGDCSAPDASSAGKHLNPHAAPHGGPMDARDARHPGDLGNVVADQEGNVSTSLEDSVLGSEPDFKIIGHAVVVHAEEDDYKSQPSGNSGDPVACGVIEPASGGATAPVPG
jgi:Cu-Zn family superoxide dismutase